MKLQQTKSKHKSNMKKPKELKIEVPEGYEIDKENSTFECIKFKPKCSTYEDVAKELFDGERAWYIDSAGIICSSTIRTHECSEPSLCTSKLQGEKLLALNKLMNVAKYLNGGWKPDFTDAENLKYIILVCKDNVCVERWQYHNYGTPCFKSKELAQQAIDILGEETIKLALAQDY